MSLAAHEQAKYKKAWAMPEYHQFSPGLHMLSLFRNMVRRSPGAGTLIDLGCGAGAASRVLSDLGWAVTMLDHVKVTPPADQKPLKLPFIKSTLWGNWGKGEHWDQGYCCDVMEHIPPEKVDKVLRNIMAHCDRVFFSICFTKDHFGAKVGHPLHLTVEPFEWWVDRLKAHGKLKGARDLLGEGVFDVVA